jgi:hypothetical protein
MVLTFFEWMEGSTLALIFQSAVWYSPIIQVMHLVAVAVFAGSLLVVDLRLLGTGLTATPVRQVAQDAHPWLVGGLIALAITGTPTMASTSIKQYYSPFWWWKMEMLALGIIFIFTIRRRVLESDAAEEGGMWPKVVALISMGLFLGVTIGARLIGLS